jgi:hypothetical protein
VKTHQQYLAFSYWFDKPWFHNREKTYCYAHHTFLLGFPTGCYLQAIKQFFWCRCRGLKKKKLPRQLHASNFSGAIAGEEEDFCNGSLSHTIFYFVFVLLYFIFACIFLSKIQKT